MFHWVHMEFIAHLGIAPCCWMVADFLGSAFGVGISASATSDMMWNDIKKAFVSTATQDIFLCVRLKIGIPQIPYLTSFHRNGALGSSIFGQHTVDGPAKSCTTWDGRKMSKTYKYHGMFTTYYLVIRISLAHPQYVGGGPCEKVWPIQCKRSSLPSGKLT